MISNTNGRREGKKRQNDQRCDMLARVKLEDEGISRHGHNMLSVNPVSMDAAPLAVAISPKGWSNFWKAVADTQIGILSGQPRTSVDMSITDTSFNT